MGNNGSVLTSLFFFSILRIFRELDIANVDCTIGSKFNWGAFPAGVIVLGVIEVGNAAEGLGLRPGSMKGRRMRIMIIKLM